VASQHGHDTNEGDKYTRTNGGDAQ
jgi:hypothetical protein